MGIRYMLAKAELEKQVRERNLQEKLETQKPELFHRLAPRHPEIRFRCQLSPNAGAVRTGDKLLVYSTTDGVTVILHSKKIGCFVPAAAADFLANFAEHEKTDCRIAEVMSEPNPLDQTIDVALRPPWPNPDPKAP